MSGPVRSATGEGHGASCRTANRPSTGRGGQRYGHAMPEPSLSRDRHRPPSGRERITLCSCHRRPVMDQASGESAPSLRRGWTATQWYGPRTAGTGSRSPRSSGPTGRTEPHRTAPVSTNHPERPAQNAQYAAERPPHPPTTPKSNLTKTHTTVRTTHTPRPLLLPSDPNPPFHVEHHTPTPHSTTPAPRFSLCRSGGGREGGGHPRGRASHTEVRYPPSRPPRVIKSGLGCGGVFGAGSLLVFFVRVCGGVAGANC